MRNKIWIDQQLVVGDNVYYVQLSADLDYSHEEDPECTRVEITQVEVALVDGDTLPTECDGATLERVIVTDHPVLTEAIDQLVWNEIQTHTEDNYQDLMRDLRDARDDHYL
jgi:lipopolysaccharide biosynthesis regulator YciM